MSTPPRVYCIPATAAPVVAVFRRGPARWSHVGRWDLEAMRYEPGAWFRGRLFPRRSDLSPDGRWLCYFAHQPGARWAHGDAWIAISRLPWLTALHAIGTCGTWTRGYAFTDRARDSVTEPLPIPWGLRPVAAEQFATERRRGWVEAQDSPARAAADAWDEQRDAVLEKRQPGGSRVLRVARTGRTAAGGRGEQAVDGLRVEYALEDTGRRQLLPDLQWADWDADGRLLTATRTGRLQVLKLGAADPELLFDEDLTSLEPRPVPSPAWAKRW